ncbi:MAG: PadR family transcriptional regulator [Mycobacteriaceae bacterium]|uniref:PadR family transcriptional regulator n=1 Tax=Corynebacterium sp. TaxID=1720 RepID=UPI003F9C60A7
MALEHAIMVSLAERPGTGYELGGQFSTSLGHFWPATRQQIYRTLARLQDGGFITCRDVAQDGRPDKKIYTLAPAGRDALHDWIAEPSAVMKIRDDLAVKLRGAEHGDMDDVLADVRNHRQAHTDRLALYRSYERTQFGTDSADSTAGTDHSGTAPLTGRRLHQFLVLRGGIRIELAFVDWCDEVIDALSTTALTTTAQRRTP